MTTEAMDDGPEYIDRDEMERCGQLADYWFTRRGWEDLHTAERRAELASRFYHGAAWYYLELMAETLYPKQ